MYQLSQNNPYYKYMISRFLVIKTWHFACVKKTNLCCKTDVQEISLKQTRASVTLTALKPHSNPSHMMEDVRNLLNPNPTHWYKNRAVKVRRKSKFSFIKTAWNVTGKTWRFTVELEKEGRRRVCVLHRDQLWVFGFVGRKNTVIQVVPVASGYLRTHRERTELYNLRIQSYSCQMYFSF